MKRYKKRPVVIEAVLWTGDNYPEMQALEGVFMDRGGKLVIPTLEGKMTASVGDFIIKGTRGEMYPCKPDVFADVYEELQD
jgi:hypothetical protein